MSLNFNMIGRRIRESRMRQHISQTEMAERIDRSISYISLIETAKKKASLGTLALISDILGTTIDELLYGNYMHGSNEFHTDMELLMSDCSSYEKRIIYEMACALKNTLRNNAGIYSNGVDSI